jgi:hypothetical protein
MAHAKRSAMPAFDEMQERLSEGSRWDFSDLSFSIRARCEWDAGCRLDYPNPEHR